MKSVKAPYEKALESLLSHERMEFEDFLECGEFKAISMSIPTDMPLYYILGDYKIHLYGNLEKIIIGSLNSMKLLIRYRVYPRDYNAVIVNVEDEALKELIRKEVKSDTGIKLICKLSKSNIITLDCVEIESYNDPLKLPYYICDNCGKNYGIEEYTTCEICCESSDSMHAVRDIHKFISDNPSILNKIFFKTT